MSDHNHECPQCNGFFECDRHDCKEDDLCLECEILNRDAALAQLREENEELKTRLLLFKCNDCNEIKTLRSRLEAAEGRVEKVRETIDAGFELGTSVQTIRELIYKILK